MRLTLDEFNALFENFERESLHLEMRDAYGTETEIPHFARWKAGEADDLHWLDGWCDTVRRGVDNGKAFRRVMIVSEPLSDYQRWTHSMIQPIVDAGEDMRWLSRRRVSSIALPGNDFYLIDGSLVVFMHYSGAGSITEIVTSSDPRDIELCRAAFDAVWPLSIPHNDYAIP